MSTGWDVGFRQLNRVHFVGIGGVGLSAIAIVLLEQGVQVSGSDLRTSPYTERLRGMGAQIHIGHAPEHVVGAQTVIMSSAVPTDNVELVAARSLGIPVLKREQIFGPLTAGRDCVAVAGTHGKTTTAAMIAWMLLLAKRDPSFVVGGTIVGLDTSARYGRGPHFVVEADEYDHAFLGFRPKLAVVTHLEVDHPDIFPDLEAMVLEFRAFLKQVDPGGTIIGCSDVPGVRSLLAEVDSGTGDRLSSRLRGPRVVAYGLDSQWDWWASDLEANNQGGMDFVAWHGGEGLGRVRLLVPGVHNVQNALAVLATAHEVGIGFDGVCSALSTFQGTERRFQVKGTAGGVTVIDDYAHHPTQIRATLAAARGRYAGRDLWAVFQPHTYSRTRALLDEFAASFGEADHVVLLPVYAAREQDTLGMSSQDIAVRADHPDLRVLSGQEEATRFLMERLRPGDVLFTLGAGDGDRIGDMLLCQLRSRDAGR